MGRVDGIDISHNNGTIDWAKVLTDHRIRYICIKATQGTGYTDSQFVHNITALRQLVPNPQGIGGAPYIGFYHFRENKPANAQAAYFRKVVGPIRLGEFVVADCEGSATGSLAEQHDLLSAIEVVFGRKPMLYGGDYPAPTDFYRWIARYRATPPGHECTVWQWGLAMVSGCPRSVDANQIMNDQELAAVCGIGVAPTPTPPPTPGPPPVIPPNVGSDAMILMAPNAVARVDGRWPFYSVVGENLIAYNGAPLKNGIVSFGNSYLSLPHGHSTILGLSWSPTGAIVVAATDGGTFTYPVA